MLEIWEPFKNLLQWFRNTNLKAVASDRVDRWIHFLHKHCRLEASALLLLLRDAFSHKSFRYSATVRLEILETHITVCNIPAQDRKTPFQGSYPRSFVTPAVGWCRQSVRDGDIILRCPGVQIPLVVRPYSSVKNRVQIKSIVHTPWILDWSPYYHLYKMGPDNDYNAIALEEFHVY